jgi:GNAT superfamily N-acetyltransferase
MTVRIEAVTDAPQGLTACVSYVDAPTVSARQLSELFRSSGIRRPVDDLPRLEKMIEHASLLIGAYVGSRLVGIARALTDFSYCCYLSDLAIAKEYQRHGIGRELVDRVKRRVGDQSMLLLLSSPEAMGCYPRIGLEAVNNGWIIKRVS